jgi:hypothetical protein
MTTPHRLGGTRHLVSGAVAGTVTSVGFAALHDLLISDIWAMLVPMMVAGALCGLCLAWSYRLGVDRATPAGWVLYNLEFVALFVLLLERRGLFAREAKGGVQAIGAVRRAESRQT